MKILGISASVPKKKASANDYIDKYSKIIVDSIKKNTGVERWREADENIFASDLAYFAAENLFNYLDISKKEIDAILFISQGHDSLVPSVSPLLQQKLKLKDSIFSLDIIAGCSGFVDGLILANGLLNSGSINKVLILSGDTSRKSIDNNDKSTSMLFGDASSAVIVEYNDANFQFVTGTDGSGTRFIRQKSNIRDLILRSYEGFTKSDFYVEIDGPEIFNFTIKRIPKMINQLLDKSGLNISDIDACIMHQANLFIINHIIKKIKIDRRKTFVPISLDDFGNTSSASIPLTMVTRMHDFLNTPKKIIMVGYGIGLSWSAISMSTETVKIAPLVEV